MAGCAAGSLRAGKVSHPRDPQLDQLGGEFYYIVKRRVGTAKTLDTLRLLEQLPIDLFPIDQPLVRATAEIKSEHALSYADAFCIATAQRLEATVLTDDPEFRSVGNLIKIRWMTK